MRRLFAGLAVTLSCHGGSRVADVPLWERPGLYGAERPEMGPPQPGDRAPDFELPTPDGPFRLASLRGHWVVLHFTASWCPYCDAEVEHLGELADAYGARGVKAVLIDVNEDDARWSEYARAHVPRSIIALRDGGGEVAKRYAPPRAQPSFEDRSAVVLDSTLVLDPSGRIRLFLFPDTKHFDPTFRVLRGELERMLAGAAEPRTREPSPSPARTSEEVVAIVVAAPARVAAGGQGAVDVGLRVEPGYHVMSDRPSLPSYIRTEVRFDDGSGIVWGETRYPPPVAFPLGGRAIATFQGETVVRVPFETSANAAAGRRVLGGTVRYQACTEGSCLFPVTRRIEAAVEVSPGER